MYSEGDLVDLLDENDEIYLPGKIVDVVTKVTGQPPYYKIEYIGWPKKDFPPAKVPVDSELIQPHMSKVKEYKAWVKYSTNLPMWPSKVYVRTPKTGSKVGRSYLTDFEKRVLVMPYGRHTKLMRPFDEGAWFAASKVRPINELCEQRIREVYEIASNLSESVTAKKQEIVACFKEAWDENEEDNVTEVFNFEFCSAGSLEINRSKGCALTAREEEAKRRVLEEGRERECKRLRYEKRQHLDLFLPPPDAQVASDDIRSSLEGKQSLAPTGSGTKVNYFARISALRSLIECGIIHRNEPQNSSILDENEDGGDGDGDSDDVVPLGEIGVVNPDEIDICNPSSGNIPDESDCCSTGTSSAGTMSGPYIVCDTADPSRSVLESIIPNSAYVDL